MCNAFHLAGNMTNAPLQRPLSPTPHMRQTTHVSLSYCRLCTLLSNHYSRVPSLFLVNQIHKVQNHSFIWQSNTVVVCQAGLQALKSRVPGPQSPSPARPNSRLQGLEGSACPLPKPKPSPEALGFSEGYVLSKIRQIS